MISYMGSELNIPYVDKKLVNYLKEVYSTKDLLNMTKYDNAEVSIGFMSGVIDVLDRLEGIVREQEGE